MTTDEPDSPPLPRYEAEDADELVLRFTVAGKPRGQPRARHVRAGGRPVSTADVSVRWWRGAIERAAREAVEAHGRPAWCSGPVRVDWEATFATDKAERHGAPMAAKPDRDNIDKAILDAMQQARLFPEDQRVSAGETRKTWGPDAKLVVVVRPDVRDAVPQRRKDSVPSWLVGNPL